MSESGRVQRWALILVAVVAAGAVAVGVMRPRRSGTPGGPDTARGEARFQLEVRFQREVGFHVGGPVGPVTFEEIAPAQDRLWVTTTAGVVVIDPVAESWTTLYADSQPLGPATVVACGARIWLQLGDTVLLLDPETRQFQARAALVGPRPPSDSPVPARCAGEGLWTLYGTSLFYVPAAATTTRRYDLTLAAREEVRDFVDAFPGGVHLLLAGPFPGGRLLRFDTATSRLDAIQPPAASGAYALERVDEGLLLRTYEPQAFLMRGPGEPWVEVRGPRDRAQPVLAEENGVLWVGASYDVSPASYFVLRYIRDARQPKDLLVLPDFYMRIRSGPRRGVQYLGMLWLVSDKGLLRVDPAGEEMVHYTLNATGSLDKQSFRIAPVEGQLRYFDGDTLRPLPGTEPVVSDSVKPAAAPDSGPPADLGEKPER